VLLAALAEGLLGLRDVHLRRGVVARRGRQSAAAARSRSPPPPTAAQRPPPPGEGQLPAAGRGPSGARLRCSTAAAAACSGSAAAVREAAPPPPHSLPARDRPLPKLHSQLAKSRAPTASPAGVLAPRGGCRTQAAPTALPTILARLLCHYHPGRAWRRTERGPARPFGGLDLNGREECQSSFAAKAGTHFGAL
jgi:hypothetical protein